LEKKSIGKQNLVSYAVFSVTLVVVLISISSILFPALIVRTASPFQDSLINPFELGALASSFFITNFVLLGITILHYTEKLPNIIRQSIKFIFDFELTPRIAFTVIGILIGIYVILSANELVNEEDWADYIVAKSATETWNVGELNLDNGFLLGFKYFLLYESLNIFGNIRVVPFIASILLLLLTYFITVEMTKKRFAGIVAMTILLQSNVFLSYDTSASYANFWILLYLLSLYLIYKRWYLSPISYVWSAFAKPLTVGFLPMTFFFIYRSEVPRKIKIQTTIPYAIILVLLVATYNVPGFLPEAYLFFDSYDFWSGFTSLAFQLRFDALVLIFLLPVTVGLFIASRKGIRHADSVMILIMGVLLSPPLLSGLLDVTIQPYRFVALVIFFAMGVGTILSKKITNLV